MKEYKHTRYDVQYLKDGEWISTTNTLTEFRLLESARASAKKLETEHNTQTRIVKTITTYTTSEEVLED